MQRWHGEILRYIIILWRWPTCKQEYNSKKLQNTVSIGQLLNSRGRQKKFFATPNSAPMFRHWTQKVFGVGWRQQQQQQQLQQLSQQRLAVATRHQIRPYQPVPAASDLFFLSSTSRSVCLAVCLAVLFSVHIVSPAELAWAAADYRRLRAYACRCICVWMYRIQQSAGLDKLVRKTTLYHLNHLLEPQST